MAISSTTTELTLRGRVLVWLFALAGGASWLAGDANARLAAALLGAPVLIDFVAKQRRLHRTRLRVAPRRTPAGAPFTETVTVTVDGPRALRECLLYEPRTMRSEPPAMLAHLARDASTPVRMRQRSAQRSHAVERVFVLVSSWPLGVFRTRSIVVVDADLVTEPARIPLAAELVQAIADTEQAPRERSALPGPEFHSLREHLPEEDARGVHALRSATLGTLVRRVTLGRLPRTVGMVLDLRRPPGRPLHQAGRRFEWSLAACASLLELLRRRGGEARVLVLAGEPADLLVRGPAQEAELLTLLAEASPSPYRSVPDDLFATIRRLEHCFWIPAGGYSAAPEFTAMPGTVTVVGGDGE